MSCAPTAASLWPASLQGCGWFLRAELRGRTQSPLGFDLIPLPAISDGSPNARSKLPFIHAAGISLEHTSCLMPCLPLYLQR